MEAKNKPITVYSQNLLISSYGLIYFSSISVPAWLIPELVIGPLESLDTKIYFFDLIVQIVVHLPLPWWIKELYNTQGIL